MKFDYDGTYCLKCKKPLLIFTEHTGELRPFCSECEKEVEAAVAKGFIKRGRSIKGKKLIYPKVPDNYYGG